MDGEAFDYIIVGAGSAGCVLADRLTEDGRSSVLLLEYGGVDRSIFIQMPAALSIPMNSKTYNWGYESEPEPHLGGRRIACPRGKVLGGSSSINGMVYVRGHPLDFERWEEEGARGWGYRNVLPYFRRAESFQGDRRRLSRRRRTADDGAWAKNQPSLRRLHRGGPAGGLCGQRRPQRRAAGGIWPARHDGEERRPMVDRQRLSQAGDETPQPRGGHPCARDPDRLRWAPRGRRPLPASRARANGEGAARGHPLRRADQFAAIAEAVGRGAGGGIALARDRRPRRPARRWREPAGPSRIHFSGRLEATDHALFAHRPIQARAHRRRMADARARPRRLQSFRGRRLHPLARRRSLSRHSVPFPADGRRL